MASVAVLAVFFLLATAGMALLFGYMIWRSEHPIDPAFLRTIYYVAFCTFTFCGVILPLFVESGQKKINIDQLRIFPISPHSLFGISLGAHLLSPEHMLYFPAFLTVCVVGIVQPGFAVVSGLALAVALLCFNVVWGYFLTLGLEAIGKKKRGRDLVGIVLTVILALCVAGPALLEQIPQLQDLQSSAFGKGTMAGLELISRQLAPVLAAEGLAALRVGGLSAGLQDLVWLWVWNLVGLGLAYRLFVGLYFGSGKRVVAGARRHADSRRKQRIRTASRTSSVIAFLPGDTLAVASKDWRYLLRSVNGKLNLALVPLVTAMTGLAIGRLLEAPVLGIDPADIALMGVLVFVTQLGNNLLYNCFAWESGGVQSYFLYPADPRRILLGKNLANGGFFGVLFLLTMLTMSVLRGLPDVTSLLTCLLFFAALVIPFTSIGNLLSIWLPVGKDPGSRDSSFSPVGRLLSICAVVPVSGIAGLFVVLPRMLGQPEMRLLSLAVLVGIQAGVYMLILNAAARILHERRERIIARLVA